MSSTITTTTKCAAHRNKTVMAEAHAKTFAAELRARQSPDFQAYPCPEVGTHWHIGHDVRSLARRISAVVAEGNAKARKRRRR